MASGKEAESSGMQHSKVEDVKGEEINLDASLSQALEGSAEHQFLVGKFYLSQAWVGDESSQKSTEAVGWLIKASRQGHEGATELLKQCLETKSGISEENIEDVAWCVETPKIEKQARSAASNIFRKLNPLDRTLSKEEYLKAVEGLADNKAERKLLEKAVKLKGDLSEEAFVEKLVKRLQGRGGLTVPSELQSEAEAEAYKSSSTFQKLTKYPGKTVMYIGDTMVEFSAKQGAGWLRSFIPTQQIHMLLVFFMYSVLSVHFFIFAIPLFLFYISFLSLIICTLQMFYSQRKMRDVKALASMLQKFNEAIDTNSAESAYTWNTLTPYFTFFGSIFLFLFSFSMVDKEWIACSEFVVVGLFFTVSCFLALSDKHDHLALISIGCSVLADLPTIMDHFPQIPVLYHIVQVFCGPGIAVQIIPNVQVNLGIPSALYLVVPVLFIRMAAKNSWEGTYRILIPHLVCFFWWQVTMMFYRYSTWVGLIRGTVGWATALLLAPVFVVGLCFAAFYYLSSFLTLSGLLKLLTTVLLLAIPAGIAVWAKKGFQVKGFSFEGRKTRIVLGILSIFTVIPFLAVYAPPEPHTKGAYLSWETYRELCSKPMWDKRDIANAQIQCDHLTHIMVSWTGTVKKVVVKSIDNPSEKFVDIFPLFIGNWLKCTYGEEYPTDPEVCANVSSTRTEADICKLRIQQGIKCHMNNMNRYLFEIWVQMPIDKENVHDVRVEARDAFKSVILGLKAGDVISFRAALQSELGNIWPVLKLYYVKCLSKELTSASVEDEDLVGGVVGSMQRAMFDTFNFFTAPVIEFGEFYDDGDSAVDSEPVET